MKKNYLYLFVFIFGALLYANTIPNKYAYDDFSVIEGNKFTRDGIGGMFGHLLNDSFTGFAGKKNLFSGGRYRPLSLITFSIEYQFFGMNPHISHFVNMLLYGFICLLILMVLSRLFRDKLVFKKFRDYFLSLSLMATILFATHPVHTEVAANIKGRDELLALLFGLLAWNSALIFTDQNRKAHAAYAGIFLFLSLLAKESAAPFLLMIPLSVWCFRSQETFKKSILISGAALLGSFALFILLRQSILGWSSGSTMPDNIIHNSFMYAKGFSERYGTTFLTLGLYLKLLFIPHPLTIDYYPFYIPYVGLTDIRSLIPILLYTLLTLGAILFTWKKNIAGFGVLFYLIFLFPVSNLPFVVGPFMGERFLFIPSLGFVIAFIWLLQKGAEKAKIIHALPYVLLTIFVLFSLKTIARNTDWKDNFTLYNTDVLTSVNSAVITKGAGHELLLRAEKTEDLNLKRDLARKAIFYLEQAMRLNKSTTEVFLLANSHYEYGDYQTALSLYLETLRIDPQYQRAWHNYFVTLPKLPDPRVKILYCDSVIRVTGIRYEPFYQKGLIFGKELGQIDSALVNLLKAYNTDTAKYECLSDIGVAFAMKGDLPQSIRYLSKALMVNPSDDKARQNLVVSLYKSGNRQRAKQVAEKRWP